MSFTDQPHYQWVMGYVWGIKHFLSSLGTAEILRPQHRPTQRTYPEADAGIDHWEPVFNGLNGPYMLLSLTFQNLRNPSDYKWYWGNYVKITCDDEVVYESEPTGHIWDDDDTRYVGRDGVWAPFFFAKKTMLIESQPRWYNGSSGRIDCVIMRFGE